MTDNPTERRYEQAGQITEIAVTVARIDERTEGTNKRLDKMNDSQAKQWDAINTNGKDIEGLKQKTSLLAAINVALTAIAGYFGVTR